MATRREVFGEIARAYRRLGDAFQELADAADRGGGGNRGGNDRRDERRDERRDDRGGENRGGGQYRGYKNADGYQRYTYDEWIDATGATEGRKQGTFHADCPKCSARQALRIGPYSKEDYDGHKAAYVSCNDGCSIRDIQAATFGGGGNRGRGGRRDDDRGREEAQW